MKFEQKALKLPLSLAKDRTRPVEIHDCISVETETTPFSQPEESSPIPRGLSGVPDTFCYPEAAPKPNFFRRGLAHLSLILFQLSTWTFHTSSWLLKTFFGYASRQVALYRELHQIAKTKSVGQIAAFLNLHSKHSHAASFLFNEFLGMSEIYLFLPEILEGANVCLHQDRGFFCRRWREHFEAYKRTSSHKYQGQECYAIGHFLFWLDPEGHTRFQFEKSPLKGFFSSLSHTADFLKYFRDNEQQGVVGSSPFTEQHCLKIQIDPAHFLSRKKPTLGH